MELARSTESLTEAAAIFLVSGVPGFCRSVSGSGSGTSSTKELSRQVPEQSLWIIDLTSRQYCHSNYRRKSRRMV